MKIKYPKIKVSKKHWQYTVAVISTSHCPGGPQAWVFNGEYPFVFTNGESAVVWTDIGQYDLSYYMKAGFGKEKLIEQMLKLLNTFSILGYSYVRFDQDGDEIDGLKQYE